MSASPSLRSTIVQKVVPTDTGSQAPAVSSDTPPTKKDKDPSRWADPIFQKQITCTPSYLHKTNMQFFGFAVDEAWVWQYYEQWRGISKKETKTIYIAVFTSVIWRLHHILGIPDLHMESVMIDDKTPANATVYEEKSGLKYVTIISMCPFAIEEWARRPTLGQVMALKELVGGEPRWWVDIHPVGYYN
ncbi:hypothetical protein P691DRAFT_780717 [Macrolepiota fuliginosa MF-IS2]|uniref:Uncharacterized protein n=1 Tax=Macrolepiota fuliginosa MF-IS2 TaxID=1400762 RepID=A0A9P5XE44_9AGAR|nr:hypothetical protein P691DRAFT_780717 [Macrolepiota fuliginosa MF-IS2]